MESRPQSIVNFERCYLASLALGILNTALVWPRTQAAYQASAQARMFGNWFLPVTILIGFGVTIALWYFIARRGSAVAKWIATVLLVLGVLGIPVGFLMHTYPTGIVGIIGVVSTVLQLVGVILLFKPDTKAWFGETSSDISGDAA